MKDKPSKALKKAMGEMKVAELSRLSGVGEQTLRNWLSDSIRPTVPLFDKAIKACGKELMIIDNDAGNCIHRLDAMTAKELRELVKIQVEEHQSLIKENQALQTAYLNLSEKWQRVRDLQRQVNTETESE